MLLKLLFFRLFVFFGVTFHFNPGEIEERERGFGMVLLLRWFGKVNSVEQVTLQDLLKVAVDFRQYIHSIIEQPEQELDGQYNKTTVEPGKETEPGEHFKLMALLNRFGVYPMSKQEAMQIARELIDKGWSD